MLNRRSELASISKLYAKLDVNSDILEMSQEAEKADLGNYLKQRLQGQIPRRKKARSQMKRFFVHVKKKREPAKKADLDDVLLGRKEENVPVVSFSQTRSRKRALASVELPKKKKKKPKKKRAKKCDQKCLDTFIQKLLRNPATLEFVYLQRADKNTFNPYDLVLTDRSSIDVADYYTLSSKGVSRFLKDGTSKFTELDAWLKEKELYERVLNQDFFKKYRLFKAFFFMQKYCVSKRINDAKTVLTDRLFSLHPVLSKPLNHVKLLCLKVREIKLFKDTSEKTLELEEFRVVQRRELEKALAELKEKTEEIIKVVDAACKDSMQAAGFGDRFRSLEALVADNGVSDDYEEGDGLPTFQMSFSDLSQKRRVCKKIISFIRLVDYLVSDALSQMNRNAISTLLAKMVHLTGKDIEEEKAVEDVFSHSGDEDRPLFCVRVRLQDDVVTIEPTKRDFDKLISQMISGYLDIIGQERIISRKVFDEYREASGVVSIESGGMKKKTILPSDQKLVEDIQYTLNASFGKVKAFVAEFVPLKEMYFENQSMDVNEFDDVDNPKTVQFFKTEMEKYKQQIVVVDDMASSKHCGIFRADSSQLKDTFRPSPRKCLGSIHTFLPRFGEKLNDILLADLSKRVSVLSTSPASVEEFVGYCTFLEETMEKAKYFDGKHLYLNQIFHLFDAEKIEESLWMNGRDKFQAQTNAKFTRLKQTITIADEAYDDRKKKFGFDISDQFTGLKEKLRLVQAEGRDCSIFDPSSDPEAIIDFLEQLSGKINNINKRAGELTNYIDMFKLPPEEIIDIHDVTDDIQLKTKLWKSLNEWTILTKEWRESVFVDLVADDVKRKVEEYNIITLQAEKGLVNNPVVEKFSVMVDEWKNLFPVVSNLKNPFFKRRHLRDLDKVFGEDIFTEIARIAKEKPENVEHITLGEILEKSILEKAETIEDISSRASNEASLDEMVKKIAGHWNEQLFEIVRYKEYFILGDAEEIVTLIEDDQIVISMILSSPYVKPIKQKVEKWQNDLRLMYAVIQQWTRLQVKWLYLESVFSSGDSNMQSDLGEENSKFKLISKFFKDQMKRTNEGRNVLSGCTQNMGLLDRFKSSNTTVEYIEKKLEQYLDRKRNLFPRLYFLSNEDLIDILSKSKNPRSVQPHLEKCFDNIKRLRFAEGSVDIISMISGEGEEVPFRTKNMKGRGAIEDWLKIVEKNMCDTVKHLIKQAIKDYMLQDHDTWVREHKCQVVLTINQIVWVKEVEKCLSSANPREELKKYHQKSLKKLNDLAKLSRSNLPKLIRHTVKTMIILEVHGVNVCEEMLNEGVSGVKDFGWLKQLRYYWDNDEGECLIKQSNSVFTYGYEYIGCKGRLVITPLTDRIIMTMTGALHLHMGGAPAGPAGTGKTETVKDLAKVLGYQCVVFNCSEGITYKTMYKFFSGIVQTGAWTCFDEFNRINIEVLSVIATQVLTIFDALKRGLKTFDFEEGKDPIVLRPTCGLFITMNPGYAGRSELPDNLKALFRPVACMLPDYQLICEVILYSEGYEDAKTLSRKMVQLYKLSNEQLSPQCHYDFGMRAIKSVLVMAGELKRRATNEPEDMTLMKAMEDSNLPKFVGSDIKLFQSIVSDLFPKLKLKKVVNEDLQKCICEVVEKKQLECVPSFIEKVIQLYDTMVVRHGVMIVGPTGAGKTTSREVLQESLTILRKEKKIDFEHFQVVHSKVLNPKSINYSELYGKFNLVTHEFLEGIIPYFAKIFNKQETLDQKWIIFDGPVDTLWIESMNSVLDDSRILCLDNSDTIRLNKTIHMLFEVEDLAVASPATVSRCGMVWMDGTTLGWESVIKSWINSLPIEKFPGETKEFLATLIDEVLGDVLSFVQSNCRELINTTEINLVTSFCDLFIGLMEYEKVAFSNEDRKNNEKINNMVLFVMTWSIGGNMIEEDRKQFDNFIQNKMEKRLRQPLKDPIYSYFLDFSTNMFTSWEQIVPSYEYDPKIPFYNIMVPTADTITYAYFAKVLSQCSKPLLLNGKTGVGKSAIVANTFARKDEKSDQELVTIQFSARTSSHRTKQAIEAKLVSRKNVLRPSGGLKKVILFIDDLNMPEPEEFGSQPPLEFIRQVLQYGGFYDLEDRNDIHWKSIKDVSVTSACGPPGGGRFPISARTTRLFHVLYIPELSQTSMEIIFSTILDGFYSTFCDEVRSISKNTVKASIDLYNTVRERFRPTPKCPHYTFNLRELSKVFQGITMVTPKEVKTLDGAVRLWIHENLRCYFDRLVSVADRENFHNMVEELTKRYFKGYLFDRKDLVEEPISFGSIMQDSADDFVYEELTKPERIPRKLDDHLANYNIRNSIKMDLVFFSNASRNLQKVVRILQQPRGNALLVGVGGVGKQSLSLFFEHYYRCMIL